MFQTPFLHDESVSQQSWHASCRRIFGSLLAGLVAGILGVTGWIGFTYYFVSHLLVRAKLGYVLCKILFVKDNRLRPD